MDTKAKHSCQRTLFALPPRDTEAKRVDRISTAQRRPYESSQQYRGCGLGEYPKEVALQEEVSGHYVLDSGTLP